MIQCRYLLSYLICNVWYLLKQFQAVSESDMNITYCDISHVTAEKNEAHLKSNFYVQILKVAIISMIMMTMIGFFIGLSENSDFQGGVWKISKVNLTGISKTTTITTGKCSLQDIYPFLPKYFLKNNRYL